MQTSGSGRAAWPELARRRGYDGCMSKSKAKVSSGRTTGKPVIKSQPEPPFPKQKQKAPGLESRLDPKPRWEATQ